MIWIGITRSSFALLLGSAAFLEDTFGGADDMGLAGKGELKNPLLMNVLSNTEGI